MPSRIAQTLCTTLFLIVLFFIDKTTTSGLWILIPAGILAAASFTLGGLINSSWYAKFPPKLTAYELNWVSRFVPFYKLLDENERLNFNTKLAFELTERDFLSMSEKDLPEEIKMMILAPAVRLNLLSSDKKAAHYHKIILYHHAFASPDQQYLHLSETQHEDGAFIFATDALEAAYLKPDNYFNTALYEWCCVFVRIHAIQDLIHIDETESWNAIGNMLSTDKTKLLNYLRQPNVDHLALLCYCYVMYPSHLQNKLPAVYHQLNHLL
jgi:Mlc titration factor MtfA (ptsG expression regulator)